MDAKEKVDISYVFIIFFLLAMGTTIFFILRQSLSPLATASTASNIPDFVAQSRSHIIIIYVILLCTFFTYVPSDVVTKYSYAFFLVLTALTGAVFYYCSNVPQLSAYYETTHKTVLLFSAIGIFIILWAYNPGKLFDTTLSPPAMAMLFLTAIFTALALIITFAVPKEYMGQYRRSLLILCGIISSAMFIGWIAWVGTHYSQKNGVTSVLLMVALVTLISTLAVKTYNTQFPAAAYGREKNALATILSNTVLYIPCLAAQAADSATSTFTKTTGIDRQKAMAGVKAVGSNIWSTPLWVWVTLAVTASCITAYYYAPNVKQVVYLNGSNQIVNAPVTCNTANTLSDYTKLNATSSASDTATNTSTTTTHYNYRYGLSFWFFLDALPPNTSPAYMRYSPIINYGNKPLVAYNADKHSLRISMGTAASSIKRNMDAPRIVYETTDVPLQKWINIVVNYDGGTVDIIMDGRLIKTVGGVAPYMTMDQLVVGEPDGLNAKVCNVIYRNTPFSASDIYYLRYLVKNNSPPVLDLRKFNLFGDPY